MLFSYSSENGKWSKGPSMVEKRGFFTLNNVGDTLGKKKQSIKVENSLFIRGQIWIYVVLQKYLNLKSCLLKCYLIAGISQKPIVKQSLDEGSLRCTVLYGRIPREKNLDKNYGNSATSTYAWPCIIKWRDCSEYGFQT